MRRSVLRVLLSTCAVTLMSVCVPAQAIPSASQAANAVPVYLDTAYSFQERAADLVSRMTLEEKAAQLSADHAPGIPRLGVQPYAYSSEGQHGIAKLGDNIDNGGFGAHGTSFPTSMTASMSWDKNLMYQETTAISDEARGELDKSLWGVGENNLGPSADDYGALTFWAPTVNMDRDPRWGRSDEGFGEDPYLVGQMAGAYINGYQGNTPDGRSATGYLKVAATAKHYALNNVEDNRTGISSDASDADIRDYYTAQFKSLIEDAHVSGLMTSYNAVNGTPAVADTYTDNQVAQRTYGFGGYITSDCGAVGTTYQNPPDGHDWAPPGWTTDGKGQNATWTDNATGAKISGAAGGEAYALRAGTALNCAGSEYSLANIKAAINVGILSEGVIDTDLTRVFTVRMQTGEFDPAGKVGYTKITKDAIESPAHDALAQKVADNSLVLLKNSGPTAGGTPVLPADAAKLNNVVILGDMAGTATLGGYSGVPAHTVSAVQGITTEIKAADPNAHVTFDAAGTSSTASAPAVLSAQTQDAVKHADLVVMLVGTNENNAGEGKDRSSLAMPGNYDSLINQTAALGNRNLALVIQADGPVKIDDIQDKVPSIVFSGYNGQDQGTALADVLLGKQNPSGHLDFTWYKDDSQLPALSDYGLSPADTGGLGRTYQYFTGKPTYPFGYGLSYTTFAYSPAEADHARVDANGTVDVSFSVTNTGTTPGAAVAQLYAASPAVPSAQLPAKRLVGFRKTDVLAPGASQTVTLPVKVRDLSLWDSKRMKSVVADGVYQLQVASSAGSTESAVNVTVSGAIIPKVQYVTVQPESVVHNAGDTIDLTGKNQWIKDDTNPAFEQRDMSVTADSVVEAVNDDESFVNLATAHVKYRTSNPAVAGVSATGQVEAVGDGTATITVTVDGVSGSFPVVVRDTVTLSAPAVAAPAVGTPVTTSYINGSSHAQSNVDLTLTVPAGWSAQATTSATFKTVGPGRRVQSTWHMTPPADAVPGSYPLTARATVHNAGPYNSRTASVAIAYPSLAAAFNNTGISDDANTTAGDIDGGGLSYSAQAAASVGLTPGAAFHHDAMTFTWPNSPAGRADNVVPAGQAVPLSGSGALGFLGTSTYGQSTGNGTIVYTDGTSQPYTLTFADWWGASPAAGTDLAATIPSINGAGGKQSQHVGLYYASVPLQAGRTVEAVILPDGSGKAVKNSTSMHVFAIATSAN